MNFSVHLPQPLLVNLDRFAKTHNTSRSGVVREAVERYLEQQSKSEWPADLRVWMEEALRPGFKPGMDDGPDYDAIRSASNEGWHAKSDAMLKEFDA